MTDLLTALGLVLVIEGLLCGGLPNLIKRLAADIVTIPDEVLRVAGLAAMVIGVLVIWLARN